MRKFILNMILLLSLTLTGCMSGSHTTFNTQQVKSATRRIVMQHNEAQTFTIKEPIYLWGITGTQANELYSADSSPESLSKLEQTIMFTVYFDN